MQRKRGFQLGSNIFRWPFCTDAQTHVCTDRCKISIMTCNGCIICTLLPSKKYVYTCSQPSNFLIEYLDLFIHANGIYTIACHISLVVFSITINYMLPVVVWKSLWDFIHNVSPHAYDLLAFQLLCWFIIMQWSLLSWPLTVIRAREPPNLI